ncbi:MAG: NAD(P)-dependent oxidoreductase [Acidobacteriota bacterium]
MKRVLLTGATGFIGRHCIAPLLESGYEVHAVSSKAQEERALHANQEFRDVRWHKANLLDSAQVTSLVGEVKPTHLLHFAWYTVPGYYWTSLENLRWVQASLDLLQAFAVHGGQRVVIAGTCAEYDWKYGYCSEQRTPLSPATLYGACKHSLQIMLEAFATQARLSAGWGRIFFVYGPYEHPYRFVSSVINALCQSKPARCSHGNQMRDFLHVEDVADAFVALLESVVSGPVNIASGCPVALKDIAYRIAKKLNRADLIQLGAIASPADEPPLLVADISRLCGEVGWRPKCDLDQRLEQTISWWNSCLTNDRQ